MQSVNNFFKDTRFYFKDEHLGMYMTVQEAFLSNDDSNFLSCWLKLLERQQVVVCMPQKKKSKKVRIDGTADAATLSLVQSAAPFRNASQMFRLCGVNIDDLDVRESLFRAWNSTPMGDSAEEKIQMMMSYLQEGSSHIPEAVVASICKPLYAKDARHIRLKLNANASLRLLSYCGGSPLFTNVGNTTFEVIKGLSFTDNRAGDVTLMSLSRILQKRLVEDADGGIDFFVWAFTAFFGRLLPSHYRKHYDVDPYSFGLGGVTNKNCATMYFSATPTDWVKKYYQGGLTSEFEPLKQVAYAIVSMYNMIQACYYNFTVVKDAQEANLSYESTEYDQIVGGAEALVQQFIGLDSVFANASSFLWNGLSHSNMEGNVISAIKKFTAMLWLLCIDRDNFLSPREQGVKSVRRYSQPLDKGLILLFKKKKKKSKVKDEPICLLAD